jgi:hypothetical protein
MMLARLMETTELDLDEPMGDKVFEQAKRGGGKLKGVDSP